jgi:uncharacterized protein (DUF433 family)
MGVSNGNASSRFPTDFPFEYSRTNVSAAVPTLRLAFICFPSFGRGFDSHRPLQKSAKSTLIRLPLLTGHPSICAYSLEFCAHFAPKSTGKGVGVFFGPLILPRLGYNYGMPQMKYTPAEASALTNLPIRTVRRLMDRRFIRPRRLRMGRSVQRLLSWEQLVYLRLEAEGLSLLPVPARRKIAKQIESDAGIDMVAISEGRALVVQVKTVRKELDERLKKLKRAESLIVEDPETMRGTPVYRGTRIPVDLIADLLKQGATVDEIIEGYPSLDGERIELAPLYLRAFPRRGRPAARPWAKRKPVRSTRHVRDMARPT